MEVPMKRLMISAFAAGRLARCGNHHAPLGFAGDEPCFRNCRHDVTAGAGANKLPIEELEDQSLVYSTTTRH